MIMNINNKSVSMRQMVLMVNFLEGHRFLACGDPRKNRRNPNFLRLWAQCAKILNSDPEGDPRSAKEWKRWFLQYKLRLLSRIRQQGTDEESAPPLTALEAQFAAVCGEDPVTGCSTERDHSNGSIDSMNNEPSDCDSEQEMQYSDNETSKSDPKCSVSDRLEVFGKIVELKLQELPENQRVIAEKIINKTMLMAQNGSLTMAHALNFAKSHKS